MSKISMKPTPEKQLIVVIYWKRKKQRNFNLASNKKIKNYPKIMYDCHTDRKLFNFFRLGTQWPNNYYISWRNYPSLKRQKNPPLKFWNPQFSVQEPHKHIFVMTKKEYIFAIAHFSCPLNQKKKLKNPPKKKNSQKIKKKLSSLGKAEKKILSLTKEINEKNIVDLFVINFFLAFLPEFGNQSCQ